MGNENSKVKIPNWVDAEYAKAKLPIPLPTQLGTDIER
jgi:hypothetical protein